MKTKDNLDINKSFFWNQKYTNNQDKWDLNKPTPILKNRSISFDTNNKLKICIPGCGKGHDALYLASIGHDVYAIDFSSNALTYLKDNNIYYDLVGKTQKNTLTIDKELKITVDELTQLNKHWFTSYFK